MSKKKVSYSVLPQVSTPVPEKLLNSLTKALVTEVAAIFELDEKPLTASLVRVIGSNHITPETTIGPMTTSVDAFLEMVNAQAVVRIEPHEVIIKGIEIGNHTIALITSLPGTAFDGTVAVSFVNLTGARLQPWAPESQKRKLASRQLANHTLKGLETMLAIVAAYQAPTPAEVRSE
jgi:hypothetical protein